MPTTGRMERYYIIIQQASWEEECFGRNNSYQSGSINEKQETIFTYAPKADKYDRVKGHHWNKLRHRRVLRENQVSGRRQRFLLITNSGFLNTL